MKTTLWVLDNGQLAEKWKRVVGDDGTTAGKLVRLRYGEGWKVYATIAGRLLEIGTVKSLARALNLLKSQGGSHAG